MQFEPFLHHIMAICTLLRNSYNPLLHLLATVLWESQVHKNLYKEVPGGNKFLKKSIFRAGLMQFAQ